MTIFDLRKRIAFVTGGNGGTGLGMAKGFASAGASVVIAGRNREIDKKSRDRPRGFNQFGLARRVARVALLR